MNDGVVERIAGHVESAPLISRFARQQKIGLARVPADRHREGGAIYGRFPDMVFMGISRRLDRDIRRNDPPKRVRSEPLNGRPNVIAQQLGRFLNSRQNVSQFINAARYDTFLNGKRRGAARYRRRVALYNMGKHPAQHAFSGGNPVCDYDDGGFVGGMNDRAADQ